MPRFFKALTARFAPDVEVTPGLGNRCDLVKQYGAGEWRVRQHGDSNHCASHNVYHTVDIEGRGLHEPLTHRQYLDRRSKILRPIGKKRAQHHHRHLAVIPKIASDLGFQGVRATAQRSIRAAPA